MIESSHTYNVSVDHISRHIYGISEIEGDTIAEILFVDNLELTLTLIAKSGTSFINVANNNTVTHFEILESAAAVLTSNYVSGLCFDREPTMHGIFNFWQEKKERC